MRRGAAAVLAALLLTAPARAEEAAAPPLPAETVKGECSHPGETVTRWLQMIDDVGTGSYRCEAASLDWGNRLTFYRDREASKVAIAFIGRREAEGGFTVTAVERALLPETPASGRCRLITPEDAGARRVLCYAREREGPGLAHLTEMVIAERDWPGAAAIPGRCSAPGIAPYVLAPWIVQQTGAQQEPVLVPQAVPACRSLTVVPGQSFAFATGAEGDGVTFSGAIDEERPELFTVTTITLPGGAQHPAQAGACLPKREADGHVAVLCMAAYSQDGATKYVEVGFIPAASRFEWPREEWEEEPAP
ncbi:MAG: hypothetical protein H2049_11950 [Porphyrobacter sp.]|nr:hypothetical protein [Porphyrobacter sp.]